MAEMIPETLPSSSTTGERRVFAALAKLPQDCLVYYEPVVRRRYPDLIVIMPEVGVLIIEVKDWRLAELTHVTPETITVRRRGLETPVMHPRKQARGYMLRLMDECARHPRAGLLMRQDGAYANRYAFPFSHVAVLSNINRSQIERDAPELANVFPRGATITREELAEWEALDGAGLAARLKASFDPWWAFPKMTAEQVDVFRSVIHPEIVIRRTETDLTVLDNRQERNARALGDGHRIVYGVAGSGKTVLLIARAKLLAGEAARRVLILCYNRLLAAHLTAVMDGRPNVKVMTFHGWGRRNGADFRGGEEDGAFGERLKPHLENGARDRGRYDAVLIDEAQDWPCSWFQCARLALKDPEKGDLLIVGDGSQSLYGRRRFTWKEAGVQAPGRVINKKFDLDRNYRNTAEILRAAQAFSAKTSGEEDGVLALPVNPDTALRNGPEPLLVKLDDAVSECHYAAALVEGWLRAGIDLHGRRSRVKPSDIAILYPRRRPDAAIKSLCDRLSGFTQAVMLAGEQPTGTLRDEAVRILPIHSSRGLQFRIVVLLWTDLLPSRFRGRDEATDRGLLYVAMTRAEDMLVVLHSGSSPYVEELYRALDAASAS